MAFRVIFSQISNLMINSQVNNLYIFWHLIPRKTNIDKYPSSPHIPADIYGKQYAHCTKRTTCGVSFRTTVCWGGVGVCVSSSTVMALRLCRNLHFCLISPCMLNSWEICIFSCTLKIFNSFYINLVFCTGKIESVLLIVNKQRETYLTTVKIVYCIQM